MLKFVAYRTKKPGSHILKYNTLPPFELAFSDQSMDDLSNNPLLDFLNENAENLTNKQKPSLLPDHFDEKVNMDFHNLQGDEKWKVKIENRLFMEPMALLKKRAVKMMFKYAMKNHMQRCICESRVRKDDIKAIVTYLKVSLLPRLFDKMTARKRLLIFVEDRRVIWRHVWKWYFGFENASMVVSHNNSLSKKRLEELTTIALSADEPKRLRATYTLAETEKGSKVLLQLLSLNTIATSVRRSIFYGLVSSSFFPDGEICTEILEQSDESAIKIGVCNLELIQKYQDLRFDGLGRISPQAIRKADGFDAESLLRGKDNVSEAEYLKRKAAMFSCAARGKSGVCQRMQKFVNDTSCNQKHTTIALHRAALEITGYFHDSLDMNTVSTAVEILVDHFGIDNGKNDSGVRVLACKSLAMIAAHSIRSSVLTELVEKHLDPVAHALQNDPDRYVRCHAMEIIVCYLAGAILHVDSISTPLGYSKECAKKAIDIVVCETSRNVVDEFLKSVIRERTMLEGKEAQKAHIIINRQIRRLCSYRKCPLTSPSSPW
jgi:hypothetical protein